MLRHPSTVLGLGDGGAHCGDVNVIDFDDLALEGPEMVYDLPAGGKRLVQRVRGYAATVKSGVVVREYDEPTGSRPGVLLRGPQSLAA